MFRLSKSQLPTQKDLWQLITRLFPICRSLTGNGVRETLAILKEHIPLKIHEVPSGTKAFDWEVPLEWNIQDAYVKDPQGHRLIDFKKSNLHVVNYSTPFEGKLTFKELEPHLYSLPDQPDAIPYITSYYAPRWGFCLSHRERQKLRQDVIYDVKIDSSLKPGSLTYADLIIKGQTTKEILISTYVCHPSMANNELSGPIVATYLATLLSAQEKPYYTYRFVFIPETIGSIVYLSLHKKKLQKNVVGGYVITCIGDPHPFSYLQSRQENTLTDRTTLHLLNAAKEPYNLYSFLDRGSDERQYCAPGIDLPIGSLMRTKYGIYPEYHTSLDNLEFVTAKALEESLLKYGQCIEALEANHTYTAVHCCEPQMGRRGLYPTLSTKESGNQVRTMMNLLAYCDGTRDLVAIAEKLGCSIMDLIPLADKLHAHHLIKMKP